MEVWRNHHIATIRKVRNRLGNISVRAKGLVTDDGQASDLPWGAFTDRSVHVIDVAGIDPLAQDLVFARAVSKLKEHLERRDPGVDHVVVFVDELNKYAPADGEETYVRRMLLELSERGRYLGMVLFSAQQFRSQVLRRVVGNAGTGRLRPDGHGRVGHAYSPVKSTDSTIWDDSFVKADMGTFVNAGSSYDQQLWGVFLLQPILLALPTRVQLTGILEMETQVPILRKRKPIQTLVTIMFS